MTPPPAAAIVLAGGGRRVFGGDKLAAEIDERPLLHRAICAVAEAAEEVVVVIRQHVFPGNALYRLAGRHVAATGVFLRLEPAEKEPAAGEEPAGMGLAGEEPAAAPPIPPPEPPRTSRSGRAARPYPPT